MPFSRFSRLFQKKGPGLRSKASSATVLLPVEVWTEIIELLLLLPNTNSLFSLKRTCRALREICGPTEGFYDTGPVPYERNVLDQSWIHQVTHLRTSREITRRNKVFQFMTSLDNFGQAWSTFTFERLVALDLTLTWGKGCGLGSTEDAEAWSNRHSRIVFPNIEHLTIRIHVLAVLQGFSLPSALAGFFEGDWLEFHRLETLLIFDESPKNFMEPLSSYHWAAIGLFVFKHYQHIQVLCLPPSWDSQHVDDSWHPEQRSDFQGYDTDPSLAYLYSLSIGQAGLHSLMYRIQPSFYIACTIRYLEVTKTSAPCHPSLRCKCTLPALPNLEVLRLHIKTGETVANWMLSYPNMRHLLLDTPSKSKLSEADLAIAQIQTDLTLISIYARVGGLRRIFIERAGTGDVLDITTSVLPPSDYAETLHTATEHLSLACKPL